MSGQLITLLALVRKELIRDDLFQHDLLRDDLLRALHPRNDVVTGAP